MPMNPSQRAISSKAATMILVLMLLGVTVPLALFSVAASSPTQSSTSSQVPFEGMTMVYYSETTPILQQQMGLSANGWVSFLFHNLAVSSSKLDISANGTVSESGQRLPIQLMTTTDYPTNEDTILFLKNGGQQSVNIYAGPVGQAIQIIPNFNVELSGTWDLHDQSTLTIPVGSFSTYRYHRSFSLGTTVLDLYASYDKVTQILLYGEVYASQQGLSALIEKITLRQTNTQFTASSSSSKCIIATAAYGSELAAPVQFLRSFRDNRVAGTYLGRSFLSAFNAWYYSWAPAVAQAEYTNDYLRAAVRVLILPLLGSLMIAEFVFDVVHPVNLEVAVLTAGIVASVLVGLVYLLPLVLLPFRFRRGLLTGRAVLYGGLLGMALTLIGTVARGNLGVLQVLTGLVVVETVIGAPMIVAKKLGTMLG